MTIWYDTDWESGSLLTQDGWTNPDGATAPQMSISADTALSNTQALKVVWEDINGIIGGNPRMFNALSGTHIYFRAGIKVLSGFQVSVNGHTKMFRFYGGAYPIFWLSNVNGFYQISEESAWDTGGASPDRSTGVAPTYGSWDQAQVEILLNTVGNADGYLKVWINGTLRINSLNRQFVGPTPSSTIGSPPLPVPSNLAFTDSAIFRQSGLGTMYFDRVAAGNESIALVGGGPDMTPPAAPTGVTVS